MSCMFRRCLIAAAAIGLVAGCSTSKKSSSAAATTQVATTTPTTVATTTTTEPTTTTSSTVDTSNLQALVIPPPTGYSFVSSLGDTSSNTNLPGAISGEIGPDEFNQAMGVPNAATTMHFSDGYGQVYHYDASPPNSLARSLEIDLMDFDTPADATAFVPQQAARFVAEGGKPTKTAIIVSGTAAFSVDQALKDPDGLYDHSVVTAKGSVAEVLLYYDSTTGPSAFLATVAADQWAKL
jgi:hypothetical protein